MESQRTDIEHLTISRRDSELVKTTLEGDQKSFARLMTLYKKRIVAIGMSFFKNSVDTEDFVQEVFFKAYTKLDTFRGDSMFSTWLTRLAYNLAINSVKRRDEYVQLSDDEILKDMSDTPEEAQIRKITGEAIREAIKELPAQYAVCLDMYFFYDISYAEISNITGLPVNTIKSHIFRAKKILRDKLVERGFV
ncbi:MAG: sigma-70 family RNA polymerase sigma factor [Treponema sp.]|uniref:RNA polymerase sigma factor n=1 Tax=Treponema sp. TaxID=166 RepID=UPI001B72E9BB|nr:sigma-70 family RNA polymerase sigma factor [Treponema sp.]MBP5403357.1 sigma-70 family RNA polymerase sigma factor [Treponema sp.]MBR5932601.1 sigma-70 family RNA polymerase sigma factor [Treponema sp.]